MAQQVTRTVCRQCHADCRLEVHSDNGRLVKIMEDRTDPRVDTNWPPQAPCKNACPGSLDAQGYIALIREGRYKEALDLIKYDVPLPGVIGRICNHPCETECERALIDEPVAICALKRFVADTVTEEGAVVPVPMRKEKVAIVGSGPAGLTCANYLARQGYASTIFEALPVAGGMLAASIPEYRLPRDILQKELKVITNLGVEIKTNTPIGKDLTIDALFGQGYKAVFVAAGAQKSKELPIEGMQLQGVYQALPLLKDKALGRLPADLFKGQRVVVIGGGEGAMDAARTSLRLGAKQVHMFCLECKEEMPAWIHDIKEAEKEGIAINNCWGPKRIIGADGKVSEIEFVGCDAVFDARGTFSPTYDEARVHSLLADAVVIAIGQSPDLSFLSGAVAVTDAGTLKVDPISLATSREGVFAGGDVQTGPTTAIEAMAAGKRAGMSIERYILGKDLKAGRTAERSKPVHPTYVNEPKSIPRQQMATVAHKERIKSFAEVELGLTEEMALKEAKRCLDCGCLRRNAAREYLYHPDRVRFPLKRVGERGNDKWQKITWDQALDEIAEKLTQLKNTYGPETLFITQGTARSTSWTGPRFINLFGSPNVVGPATICYGPAVSTTAAMIGWPLVYRGDVTIDRNKEGKFATKCVMLLGISPSMAYPRLWRTLGEAMNEGTKLIVIDPRKTKEAELADIWLQLRPGTDTALLLSMIHVIIEKGLYDKEFVEKWCYGFQELKQRAAEYPPEKVAEICWVPADQIVEAAVLYATTKPGASVHGMGGEQQENSIELIQAKTILSAIVGNIDVEGGDWVPGTPVGTPVKPGPVAPGLELSGKMVPGQKGKQIGADRFKLLAHEGRDLIWSHNKNMWLGAPPLRAYSNYPLVVRAILTGKPYPVRAGITCFSNPMVHMANTKMVYQALKSLDLYVVKEFWMTPSAQLADYVLPSAAWIERVNAEPYGVGGATVAGEVGLPPKIEGEYDYWTEYEFYRGLGLRLGQAEYWQGETLQDFFSGRFKKRMGLSYEEFMEKENGVYEPTPEYRKYERMGGFATATGKLELASKVFEQLGYDPLPRFEEPKESPFSTPELSKEYPLMLITGGRLYGYYHSEHRQIESIRRRNPDPHVQIHPRTAKELGIEDGDWVWIATLRGVIRMRALFFDGIHPRVVHCEHSWWRPERPGQEPWLRGVWESTVNVLTDDNPDRCNPRGGGWPLKTAMCKVYKAQEF